MAFKYFALKSYVIIGVMLWVNTLGLKLENNGTLVSISPDVEEGTVTERSIDRGKVGIILS